MAAFIAGKYDLGYDASGTITRVDWVQLKDTLKQKRPKLQTMEFAANQMSHVYMRTDKPPFNDVRVRRAISLAFDRQGLLDAVAEGVGVFNPAVPAAFKEWSLPVDQLGEGAQYYKFDPARAKKLLAEAGYPNGFQATVSYATYGSTVMVDSLQLLLKYLKDVGIDAKANQQEYGAYIASTLLREVRVDGVRAADAVPRPGQLPVRPPHAGRAQEPEPRQRPGAGRHADPPAPHRRRGQAARGAARHPAAPGQAAVLRVRAVRRLHRRVGRRAQELFPEPRLRLGRAVTAAWLDR